MISFSLESYQAFLFFWIIVQRAHILRLVILVIVINLHAENKKKERSASNTHKLNIMASTGACVIVVCKSLIRICNSYDAQREDEDNDAALSGSVQHKYLNADDSH
jgi:heme/copper-type cytochrome/quinol oxidase subunit 2